jgi:hypothetical protein
VTDVNAFSQSSGRFSAAPGSGQCVGPGGFAGDDPAVGGDEHALAARGAEIEARVDGLGDLAHRRLPRG